MTAVRSETAGSVIAVLVSPGDHVAAGDELVLTESMKMEFPIFSPVSGTVRQVHVAEGATVEEDDVVVDVDPDASGATR